MNAHPPKRRKTGDLSKPATPNLRRDSERPSSARASFMSPTRASLSRFNPSLLPQPRSASTGPVRQNASAPSYTPNAAQGAMTPNQIPAGDFMNQFNAQMQQMMTAAMGQFSGGAAAGSPAFVNSAAFAANPTLPSIPTGDETDAQMEQMREEIRRRKTRERAESERQGSTPIVDPPPKRMQSEPIQSSMADQDDELSMNLDIVPPATTGAARARPGGVRRSVGARSVSRGVSEQAPEPSIVEDEPDEISPEAARQVPRMKSLTADGDELPDTPEIIRRQMELDDHPPRGVLFSSPSKRRATTGKSPRKALAERQIQVSTQKARPAAKETSKPAVVILQPKSREAPAAPTPASLSDVQLQAKNDEKAKLDDELKKLKREVGQFERFAKDCETDAEFDLRPVVELLNASKKQDVAKVNEPALSSLLTSFLPFSVPIAAPSSAKEKPEQQVLPSHAPLKEDNPLPLASLFTPLKISSETETPKPKPGTEDLVQHHKLTLSSPGSLLSCTLDFDIVSAPSTAAEPRIDSLSISNLSSWAKPEVGAWLEARCDEGDVAAVGYALGRYWDIALKRANCWIECEKAFPHLVEAKGADGPTGRKDEQQETGVKFSRRQLVPHLGRQSLTLQNEDAKLQISWKLQPDWTGEIESTVTVYPGLPQSWREGDTSDALRKIPTTFDALMRERGVMQATKVIVGLLFDTKL